MEPLMPRAGHGTMPSSMKTFHRLAAWQQGAGSRSAFRSRRAASYSLLFSPRLSHICPLRNRWPQAWADVRALPRLRKTTRRFCGMKAVRRAPGVRQGGTALFRLSELSGRCREEHRAPAASALFVDVLPAQAWACRVSIKNGQKKAPLGAGRRCGKARPAWPNVR